MKLPNFIIVGGAKCGSTAVYEYLKQNPTIEFSRIKEPKYFTKNARKNRINGPGDLEACKQGVSSLEEYKKLFYDCNKSWVGEASADSLYYYDTAIPEIKKLLGNPKIVIVLRNPIERAISAYTFMIQNGRESMGIEMGEALRLEEDRIKNGYEFIWHYRSAGLYSSSIKAYLENFSKVKIVSFDELKFDCLGCINSINEFITGCNYSGFDVSKKHNTSGMPRNVILGQLAFSRGTVIRRIRKINKNVLITIVGNKNYLELRRRLISLNTKRYLPEEKVIRELKEFYIDDVFLLDQLVDFDVKYWIK